MRIISLVRTRDEELDIARHCKQHDFADLILVADGGSSDRTIEIAKQFSNVKVRAFRELVSLKQGYTRNPDYAHLNFLFEWAEEEGADWIVLDDCDTNPNFLLRRNARMIIEGAEELSYLGVQARQVFLWENNQWFPEMGSQKYWAWRADLRIRAYGEIPHYSLKALAKGDWGIGADGIFFDFDKNDTIDLDLPYCRIHTVWESREKADKQAEVYIKSGIVPEDTRFPTEFAGEPAPRERWIKYED